MSISASQEEIQKRDEEVLNVVTRIKPLQKLIRDYLDVPDHLMRTFILSSNADEFVCSDYHIATLRAGDKSIFIRDLLTGANITSIKLKKDIACPELCLSANSKYLSVFDTFMFSKTPRPTMEVYEAFIAGAKYTVPLTSSKYAFSVDGSQLLNATFLEGYKKLVIEAHDLCAGQKKSRNVYVLEVANDWYSDTAQFSRNRDYFFMSFHKNSQFLLCILNLATGNIVKYTVEIPEKHIVNFKLSANGKYILAQGHPIAAEERYHSAPLTESHWSNSEYIRQYPVSDNGSDMEIVSKLDHWMSGNFPAALNIMYVPFEINDGKYMVGYARDRQKRVQKIHIFKNQAFDLDCQKPAVIEIRDNNKSKKSSCIIV